MRWTEDILPSALLLAVVVAVFLLAIGFGRLPFN